MEFSTDPKQKWERKIFDEQILQGLSNRQRSEIETNRDLIKPIEQLLCDVHEETHNANRTDLENIAGAQKRMVSLMARVAISNEKIDRQMTCLTWAIGIMTFMLVILTVILLLKE